MSEKRGPKNGKTWSVPLFVLFAPLFAAEELIDYELININENQDIEDWLSLDLSWGHNGEHDGDLVTTASPSGPEDIADNRWDDPATWLLRHNGDLDGLWGIIGTDMDEGDPRQLRGQEYEFVSVVEAEDSGQEYEIVSVVDGDNTIEVALIGTIDYVDIPQDWIV